MTIRRYLITIVRSGRDGCSKQHAGRITHAASDRLTAGWAIRRSKLIIDLTFILDLLAHHLFAEVVERRSLDKRWISHRGAINAVTPTSRFNERRPPTRAVRAFVDVRGKAS